MIQLYNNQTVRNSMKLYIWYNPEERMYQKGSKDQFDSLVTGSPNGQSFLMLYQLNELSERLAKKIIHELNAAHREHKMTH